MEKKFSLILYLIIILVILGGLFLLIFKGPIMDSFHQQTVGGYAQTISGDTTAAKVASSSALDISILKLPRFIALVNNVTNFNFDNICWRPDTVTSQPTVLPLVSASGGEATGTAETVTAHCVQGNSLPFSVPKKSPQ